MLLYKRKKCNAAAEEIRREKGQDIMDSWKKGFGQEDTGIIWQDKRDGYLRGN